MALEVIKKRMGICWKGQQGAGLLVRTNINTIFLIGLLKQYVYEPIKNCHSTLRIYSWEDIKMFKDTSSKMPRRVKTGSNLNIQ